VLRHAASAATQRGHRQDGNTLSRLGRQRMEPPAISPHAVMSRPTRCTRRFLISYSGAYPHSPMSASRHGRMTGNRGELSACRPLSQTRRNPGEM
jgi:hypothetical protein